MVECKVTIVSITVFENGDWASAEWRLNFGVDGQTQQWRRNGVEDNRTYNIGYNFTVQKESCSDEVDITISGYEEDNPGFPWYDDHANIYTLTRRVPCNAGRQVFVGSGTEGISYEVIVDLRCEEPVVVIGWVEFIGYVLEFLWPRIDTQAMFSYRITPTGSSQKREFSPDDKKKKPEEEVLLRLGIQKMARYGWQLIHIDEGRRLIFKKK